MVTSAKGLKGEGTEGEGASERAGGRTRGMKSAGKGREEVSRRGQAAPTSHPGTQSMVSKGIDSKLSAILVFFGRSDLELGPQTPQARPHLINAP